MGKLCYAGARNQALGELFILAGLRKKRTPIARELKRMPIRENIMDNPIIGPWLRESTDEGRIEGMVEGQLEILSSQIAKRFGTLPATLHTKLAGLQPEELRAIGLRLFDVNSIDELFANF